MTTLSLSLPFDSFWNVVACWAITVGLTSEGRAATRKLSRFVAPISAAVAIHASSHHNPVGTRTESKPLDSAARASWVR